MRQSNTHCAAAIGVHSARSTGERDAPFMTVATTIVGSRADTTRRRSAQCPIAPPTTSATALHKQAAAALTTRSRNGSRPGAPPP
jgi:hypothetical protein